MLFSREKLGTLFAALVYQNSLHALVCVQGNFIKGSFAVEFLNRTTRPIPVTASAVEMQAILEVRVAQPSLHIVGMQCCHVMQWQRGIGNRNCWFTVWPGGP